MPDDTDQRGVIGSGNIPESGVPTTPQWVFGEFGIKKFAIESRIKPYEVGSDAHYDQAIENLDVAAGGLVRACDPMVIEGVIQSGNSEITMVIVPYREKKEDKSDPGNFVVVTILGTGSSEITKYDIYAQYWAITECFLQNVIDESERDIIERFRHDEFGHLSGALKDRIILVNYLTKGFRLEINADQSVENYRKAILGLAMHRCISGHPINYVGDIDFSLNSDADTLISAFSLPGLRQ